MLGITSLATGALMAGPMVVVQAPSLVVQTPVPGPVAPAVTVGIAVPDSYVWDGDEYVGWVGDQYYYLGPDHVWLGLDAPRQARFHDWQRVHGDWRTHAIPNEKYRRDAHGHEAPVRNLHAAPDMHAAPDRDHGHDSGDRHDH